MIAIAFIWLLAIIAGPAYAQTSPTGPGAQEQVGPVVNCTCPAGTIAVSNYNWSASLGPFPCNCLAVPSTPPTITYTTCPATFTYFGSTQARQDAGTAWNCQTGSDGSLWLENRANPSAGTCDIWSGDVGRSPVECRSQIINNSFTLHPNSPVTFSFDFQAVPGPANDRQGNEIFEIMNWSSSPLNTPCCLAMIQLWNNGGTEYVQFIISGGMGGSVCKSNYTPGASFCSSNLHTYGDAPVLTRGVWHTVSCNWLDKEGAAGGYLVCTYDGATVMNYSGPTGYSGVSLTKYKTAADYGELPPPGSSDTDQIYLFRNGNYPSN